MKIKRLLAAALALLLLCASASAFSDDAQVGRAYRSAVREMTEQGVLRGYDDGAFHPEYILTREQAAKIIAYMILGEKNADALTANKAIYTDVAADRWSAPYIAWCTGRGILAGYGDGSFGPGDDLTGRQFTKMLLCAYDLGDSSRYVGEKWAENVSSDANALGLFTGDSAMNSDKPLQRQQAALLACNAQAAAAKPAAPTPSGGGSSGGGSSGGGGSSSGGGGSSGGGSSGGSSGGGSSSGGGGSSGGGSYIEDGEVD